MHMECEITGMEYFLEGYEKEYYLKYRECIPMKWGGVKNQDREKVYKQALDEGKTWKEITGFSVTRDMVL